MPSASSTSSTTTATVPSTTVPAVAAPNAATPNAAGQSITLAKSASISSFSAAGTTVNYSYLVTNTGSGTLTNVTVTDPMTGLSVINCGNDSNVTSSLAANAHVTCTATYTTTAADVTAGKITNTGTVTGTPATGANVTATSTVTIPLAAITIVKSASISSSPWRAPR